MRKTILISFIAAATFVCGGCDPLTMHKVASTVFDGVPSMPSPEQYCRDYHDQAKLDELAAERKQQKDVILGSSHPPYAAKRCNDCHDKNTDSGFVVAADVLCDHCHKGFLKGAFQHGPAAVGACLKCHLPHSSQNPSLLIKPKGQLCDVCHAEMRTARGLHATMITKGLVCTDCHDPHGGNNRFFLR
jgi:predicted CXXCH cytochrome family protein